MPRPFSGPAQIVTGHPVMTASFLFDLPEASDRAFRPDEILGASPLAGS